MPYSERTERLRWSTTEPGIRHDVAINNGFSPRLGGLLFIWPSVKIGTDTVAGDQRLCLLGQAAPGSNSDTLLTGDNVVCDHVVCDHVVVGRVVAGDAEEDEGIGFEVSVAGGSVAQ